MPEGDTLHKIARAVAPDLEGAPVRRLWLREAGEVGRLVGRHVTCVEAVGKHLVIALEGDWLLRTHLGMHGSWHRYRPGEPWQRSRASAVVELETDAWVFVCFRASQAELVRGRGAPRRALPALTRLGPDLVREDTDLDAAITRARTLVPGAASVAEVLLDQRVAAGIGNVYKSEVLFLRRVHPETAVSDLPDDVLRGLYALAGELLRHNLGTVRRETRTAAGSRLWVYGRERRPCLRCGAPIRRIRQGVQDRSTWFCPRCQPRPAGGEGRRGAG